MMHSWKFEGSSRIPIKLWETLNRFYAQPYIFTENGEKMVDWFSYNSDTLCRLAKHEDILAKKFGMNATKENLAELLEALESFYCD